MIATNPLSVKEIKEIAHKIREKYKVDKDTFFPIMNVLDNLHYSGKLTYMIVDEDDELLDENIPAMYNARENYIYIKESVFEEYDRGEYRSAFTIAHELFHYIQVQILNFSFEEKENMQWYENPEWQANEFAGQLLIPEEFIDLPSEEIAVKFHVTLDCAYTRKVKVLKRRK